MTPLENEPEHELQTLMKQSEHSAPNDRSEHSEPNDRSELSELSYGDWAEFAQLTGLMEMTDPAADRLPKERRRFTFPNKWVLLTLAVLLLLMWLGLTNRNAAREPQSMGSTKTVHSQPLQSDQTAAKIVVDIHGDVHHPGVFELPANSRVRDAIEAAGGFVHADDAQFINAAMALDDGQEVFVPGPSAANPANASARVTAVGINTSQPNPSEAATGNLVRSGTGDTPVMRLDINTADEASFETLPGIGPTRAAAIVEYRKQHGGFRSIAELKNVPGIGPKTWDKIQPYVITAPNP